MVLPEDRSPVDVNQDLRGEERKWGVSQDLNGERKGRSIGASATPRDKEGSGPGEGHPPRCSSHRGPHSCGVTADDAHTSDAQHKQLIQARLAHSTDAHD